MSNGQERNDDSEVAGDTNCPTWILPVVNSPGRCKCGSTLGGIVKCDLRHSMSPSRWDTALRMTLLRMKHMLLNVHTSSTAIQRQRSTKPYHAVLWNSIQLCVALSIDRAEHVASHGPGVFSADFKCYPCSGSYHGWGLYLYYSSYSPSLFSFSS